MKLPIILLSIILISCSSDPSRNIASLTEPYILGEVNRKQSKVSLLAPEEGQKNLSYTFHVQLKNDNGTYIDCNKKKLSIRTKNGKKIRFSFERVMAGHYYLTIEQNGKKNLDTVDVYYKQKPLRQDVHLNVSPPDPAQSKMVILSNQDNKLIVELTLKDERKRPLDRSLEPEVVLDGAGEVGHLEYVKPGVWHFPVTYPEHNQLMYFSVRIYGVSLDRILRYQHIEK